MVMAQGEERDVKRRSRGGDYALRRRGIKEEKEEKKGIEGKEDVEEEEGKKRW